MTRERWEEIKVILLDAVPSSQMHWPDNVLKAIREIEMELFGRDFRKDKERMKKQPEQSNRVMKAKELAKLLLKYPDADCYIITSHSPYETSPIVGISFSDDDNTLIVHK